MARPGWTSYNRRDETRQFPARVIPTIWLSSGSHETLRGIPEAILVSPELVEASSHEQPHAPRLRIFLPSFDKHLDVIDINAHLDDNECLIYQQRR